MTPWRDRFGLAPPGAPRAAAEAAGFRLGARGTHSSRTMMLEDLAAALDSTAVGAGRDDYREAIVDANCLSKPTASTRALSRRRLSELYGLDPRAPLFRVLRRLRPLDRAARPLLALLAAVARDLLLAASAPPVLDLPPGAGLRRRPRRRSRSPSPMRHSPRSGSGCSTATRRARDRALDVHIDWVLAARDLLSAAGLDGAAALVAAPEDANSVEWPIEQTRALEASARAFWPLGDTGLARRLGRIACPTLLLRGAEDRILPRSYADRFAAGVSGPVEVRILAAAAHRPELDRPEEAARLVADFIG